MLPLMRVRGVGDELSGCRELELANGCQLLPVLTNDSLRCYVQFRRITAAEEMLIVRVRRTLASKTAGVWPSARIRPNGELVALGASCALFKSSTTITVTAMAST